MELKDLLKFIDIEDQRLQERFNYDDKEKIILARTVKIAEEVGELCSEVLASSALQRKEKLDKHSREDLEDEFADVLFTTMLLAKTMDVDIVKAIEKKWAKVNKRYEKGNQNL